MLRALGAYRKIPVENRELSNSEKDYDLLPKVVEFSVENGNRGKEEHMFEFPNPQEKEKKKEQDDSVKVEMKMWDKCNIGEKDLPLEKEFDQQSFEEDFIQRTMVRILTR
ncbi:hypothetical protein NE237_020156 [Protea cynaroides]|uniref:Uncharacterized protein n=1 Tax=Protea cynaroides TaxID=273540 RepID=A0A9Q0H5G4_9MAGN|nr:hypothetical protein NE237_020156 [Protea cynaroides]